jgi:hypothetical protein
VTKLTEVVNKLTLLTEGTAANGAPADNATEKV